jgi:3-phosphoshikimate 1-carboxyvinyltransferase
MNITLAKSKIRSGRSEITITGSKSESNRLLLLQALYPEIEITNLSNSDDSLLMLKALSATEDVIDIHHAGTAMRFLTVYFATRNDREVILTGSQRMQERPIGTLVEALRTLGADIEYVNSDGFPPLKICGQRLVKCQVTLKANVSSQYISALLLIAPHLENGLELTLDGEITSLPYIKMTLGLLNTIGVSTDFTENKICVAPFDGQLISRSIAVESDWSSASYFYSLVALSDLGTELTLTTYLKHSLQGDAILADIYREFGVDTYFKDGAITLRKIGQNLEAKHFQLNRSPDIAQTIAVTCFALGIACDLYGLHTLKIKETDRLAALKSEIKKLGGQVRITKDSLHLSSSGSINKSVSIATYNDHRMAMAFAPLALKTSVIIEDASVVSKSYPTFWNDLESLGIKINK